MLTDTEQPVILSQVDYIVTAAQALPYAQPFLNLGPIVAFNATAVYKNLAHEASRTGFGNPLCVGGTAKALFPVGLKGYKVAANRKMYQLFTKMVTDTPALDGSFVQFEAYALPGMKAVDPASSAYAHREDNITDCSRYGMTMLDH